MKQNDRLTPVGKEIGEDVRAIECGILRPKVDDISCKLLGYDTMNHTMHPLFKN
jgi:hypothetical protein